MAITLTGNTGLFTQLGKIFYAQELINAARGTTVENQFDAIITQFEYLADEIDIQRLIENLMREFVNWREVNTATAALQSMASNMLVKFADDDVNLENLDVRIAMLELIDQMEGAGGESNPDNDVNASTAAASVTAGTGNNTDAELTVSVLNGDGRNAENTLGETVRGTVTSVSGNGGIALAGEASVYTIDSSQWPQGSAASASQSAAASGLLANGSFDAEDDRDNTPDDWDVVVGSIGTTIKMTNYEVQTVTITGTPTSGTFILVYTDVNSHVQYTAPVAYNAGAAVVQSALRALSGLASVTVSRSGTAPNYVYTVTFKQAHPPGDIPTLSSSDTFDAGGLSHGTTVAGTAHVLRGKAVEFDGNGTNLTSIQQRLSGLKRRTVYAWNVYLKMDVFPAAGALVVELVDGTGTVIADAQGTNNTTTQSLISGGGLSITAFTAVNGYFRMPAVVPDVVNFRIRLSTAITSGSSLFIDEATFLAATELYTGGPFVAFFRGGTDLGADDTWEITVTNDRAGEFQEWFRRNFRQDDLLLPSNSAGGETISDGLIS